MTVRWSAGADDDLAEIIAYIAADDPSTAGRVLEKVLDTTANLARHPGLGRPGRVTGTRELVVSGLPYIVIYRESVVDILILRILHAARNWPAAS